jgi:hypothetical protein
MHKLSHTTSDIAEEILEIVTELGYLALAIVLAELYVAMTSRLLSDFRLYLLEIL